MGSIGRTKASTVVVNQDSQGGSDGPETVEATCLSYPTDR